MKGCKGGCGSPLHDARQPNETVASRDCRAGGAWLDMG